MRYLKDGEFPWKGDGKLVFSLDKDAPPTIAQVLLKLADMYTPAAKAQLTVAECRHLITATAVLEAPPEDGLLAFEDTHFEALRKTVSAMAEIITINGFWRNRVVIEDIFDGAKAKRE